MTNLSNIGIVGSGPTALYLLKYILDDNLTLRDHIQTITVFEKESKLGMGMPYRPKTTDIYNLANISSEEIPLLIISFADWLRNQSAQSLNGFNIPNQEIDDSEVYSRVALGSYFHDQFNQLILAIECCGINVVRYAESEVVDIKRISDAHVKITTANGDQFDCSAVVIANGHEWNEKDKESAGYYASPWPIHKLIPENGQVYNFPIGILGSSLSAFDVVTSLSHRHGKFTREGGKLSYRKDDNNPNFKIVLHSSAGWLPHLQYEQLKPIREIYRHFDRKQLLDLVNEQGFLRIENYFDQLCRPALIKAFAKDKMSDVATMLENRNFSFDDLVNVMKERHIYTNSFEGMRLEMHTAKNSVYNKIPIYWMETLDDLMYSLNYHAELLPAEDHLFFHKKIMSFLMNVIAALPLQSAEILLALYDAKTIELKAGRVNFNENSFAGNQTEVEIQSSDGNLALATYKLFVNCGGSKKLETDDYPFPTLVEDGTISSASAVFADEHNVSESTLNDSFKDDFGARKLKLSGIAIDGSYKTIDKQGDTNSNIFDINFTHTNGIRPYSYGLQACSATSLILVQSWLFEVNEGVEIGTSVENLTELYEENDDL